MCGLTWRAPAPRGGAVANPAEMLATLVASLHDKAGRVAVAGFYDSRAAWRPASPALPLDLS